MTRLIFILTILALASACDERIEPGQTTVAPVVLSGLATSRVEAVAAPARYALPGTLESADRGLLTARIAGQVARILVSEGQTVQPGKPLLELGGETASSALQAAGSEVNVAERRLAEAQSLQKLAEETYGRFLKLREARAVTPHEFSRIETERDTAAERLGAAKAALQASRAARAGARTMADQARVTAPYAGQVAEVLVDVGSTVLPGTPLLSLDRSGPWRVRVALPEGMAARYRVGDHLQVEIPALAKVLNATLTELLPGADPASRSMTAWLTLPAEETLQSGLFARVLMAAEAGLTTLMIPASAVVTRGQLTGVYVVEEDLLHYRLVRTGIAHADRVEILSGLRAGEEIIVADLARARHGARLERN